MGPDLDLSEISRRKNSGERKKRKSFEDPRLIWVRVCKPRNWINAGWDMERGMVGVETLPSDIIEISAPFAAVEYRFFSRRTKHNIKLKTSGMKC